MPHAESRAEAQLIRLLDAERRALLAGQYGELDRLARRKEELVTRLAALSCQEAALVRVRAALARNQRLIAAAIDGIKTARGLAGQAAPPFKTYLPDGRPEDTGATRRSIERRL